MPGLGAIRAGEGALRALRVFNAASYFTYFWKMKILST